MDFIKQLLITHRFKDHSIPKEIIAFISECLRVQHKWGLLPGEKNLSPCWMSLHRRWRLLISKQRHWSAMSSLVPSLWVAFWWHAQMSTAWSRNYVLTMFPSPFRCDSTISLVNVIRTHESNRLTRKSFESLQNTKLSVSAKICFHIKFFKSGG